MARGLDTATKTALAQDVVRFAHLLKVQLESSTIYLTDAFHDLVYDSNTYTATGSLLQFGSIKESAVLQVGNIEIVLTGISSDAVSAAMDGTLINKQLTIHRAIIQANSGTYVSTPRQVFDGNINSYAIRESGTDSVISVKAASHFANFMQRNGRTTNTSTQQNTVRYGSTAKFSTDRGFEFASAMIRDIKWGQV